MLLIRRILIVLLLCTFSLSAYPFWIWSPKTQKWKNPRYSPLATPYLQYKAAEKYFDNKQYKEASKEFKKLLTHYPDSKEAADAQYYLGRCLEALNNPYQAFLEYHKVIDSYPNSKKINEVVEREYQIGEYFLNREPKKWLGISIYDLTEHPSLEIFKKIVEKAPYSTYAPQAQYKLGLLLMQLGRYDEARDAFQKVIDTYSDSEWVSPSKYQLAIATSKASFGADYDSTSIQEATKRLDEFVKKHPDADISPQAQKQLKELRDREAKKNYDIAQFYEIQGRYASALIYYKVVVDKYSDSGFYQNSEAKIRELNDLAENKISKSEYEKNRKQELRAEKKAAAASLKEEKIRAKQEKREEKRRKKEEARNAKVSRVEGSNTSDEKAGAAMTQEAVQPEPEEVKSEAASQVSASSEQPDTAQDAAPEASEPGSQVPAGDQDTQTSLGDDGLKLGQPSTERKIRFGHELDDESQTGEEGNQ